MSLTSKDLATKCQIIRIGMGFEIRASKLQNTATQKLKLTDMNINIFTIKSQEGLQQAQLLAQSFGQQQIENEHLFKAIFEVDENVAPFILKKLNVNVPLFEQILDSTIQSFPKVSGGTLQFSREANTTLNEAEIIAKKMNDEYVSIEHLILAIFKSKSKVTVENNSEIDELRVLLNKKIGYKYTLETEKELFDVSHHLLKDTGIKTKIIAQYIPIINQQVNKYMSDLDFFVNFELDNNFNEVIKSRNRDEFKYSSFSEGEKMRLNLALLFSWRAIAKMRNSASTNLLIMDEVADSSLDEEGIQGFLHIIENLGMDTNVFLISHHGDAMYDKFHSVIRMEKVNNFSRIATSE